MGINHERTATLGATLLLVMLLLAMLLARVNLGPAATQALALVLGGIGIGLALTCAWRVCTAADPPAAGQCDPPCH